MLDVIHVVASVDPRTGGPARTVPALAAAQIEAGAYAAIATIGPAPDELAARHPRLPVHAFPARPGPLGARAACATGLAEFLLKTPARAIHAHGLWQRPLHYASRAALAQKIPLVIAPRGMLEPWARAHHPWRKKIAAALLHPGAFFAASGWHATGDQEAGTLRGLGHGPVCSAPNGIEAPAPSASAFARAAWITAYPVLRDTRVALFYGRLHRKKRVAELIDVWRSAPRPGWTLLVAGIPEGFSVADLAARAAATGGRSGGAVVVADGAGLPPPYAVAEFFWLPSHSENFGQAVAEALASGLPALVTDTLPWEELNPVGAGRHAPWTAHPALLDALIATPPEVLAAMGARGRDWVLSRYRWSDSAQTLLDFYHTLSPARSE